MQLLIGLFLLVLLQGCNQTPNHAQQVSVNDGVSITRTDHNAIISKEALTNISNSVGSLLQTNIDLFNAQEAISFAQKTRYCDVSGMKELFLSNKTDAISNIIEYNDCKQSGHVQNGKINFDYTDTNNDSKCPKSFKLKIEKTFTFNQLKLSDSALIKGNVQYNPEGKITRIDFKINGNVTYDDENYHLQNIAQSTKY